MESSTPFPRTNILGVGVSALTMSEAVEHIATLIEQRDRQYVMVAAVYDIMAAQRDVTLRRIINSASIVTPDGMPLVFLSRWMSKRPVKRVYGPDLMLHASAMLAERGFSSYYYGGAAGVPEQLAEVMTARFPGLKIAGTHSPPFRQLTPAEDAEIVARINAAVPDVIWVGLGSLKQTLWMAQHRSQLTAPVLIGVGAAFDFHTGRVRQAPVWMQQHALEWLFRLMVEPRRLWRRYVFNNPLFVWFVLLQFLGLRRIPLTDHRD